MNKQLILALLLITVFMFGCSVLKKPEATQSQVKAIKTEPQASAVKENITTDLEDVNKELTEIEKILEE